MSNLKLAHVVLQSTRRDEMVAWYKRVLGSHVVFENEMLTFLTFDEEHHRIAIGAIPGLVERTPNTVGMAHVAFTFDDLDGLLDRYNELEAVGIKPLVPVQHGVTTSIYYEDPDGNTVEMQIDNFATAEGATEYMMGEEYSADPIGPSFDPRLMAEERKKGTAVEKITSRAWALSGPELPNPLPLLLRLP